MMEETDWRKVVTDPEEIRVFEGLADEKWDWRTVRGLSASAGLPQEAIRKVLEAK